MNIQIPSNQEIKDQIKEYVDLQKQIKSMTDRLEQIKENLKNIAFDKVIAKAETTGIISKKNTIQIDNYSFNLSLREKKTLTADQYNLLKDYQDLCKTSTTYSFDEKLMAKYRQILAKKFMEIEEIPLKDRNRLIKSEIEFSLNQNIFNSLDKYSLKESEKIKEFLNTVGYVSTLNGLKV